MIPIDHDRPRTLKMRMARVQSQMFLLLTLFSCANYGVPLSDIASEINATLYTGPVLIQPGNQLDLKFPELPDWSQLVTVRVDGMASLPYLGEVTVAGQSIGGLRSKLLDAYKGTPEAPNDLVINLGNALLDIPEIASGVTVTGEISRPGIVQLSGHRLTLVDAIGRAGGHLKSSALLANTLLIRRSPATGAQRSWRIDARVSHWGKGEPLYLQQFDLVLVPNTPVDEVNIWIDKYITQNIPGSALLPFLIGISVGNSNGS